VTSFDLLFFTATTAIGVVRGEEKQVIYSHSLAHRTQIGFSNKTKPSWVCWGLTEELWAKYSKYSEYNFMGENRYSPVRLEVVSTQRLYKGSKKQLALHQTNHITLLWFTNPFTNHTL